MMLHIDSSLLGAGSASRALTAEIVRAAGLAFGPDACAAMLNAWQQSSAIAA